MVEHQVEGLVVFAQWPLVAAEARAAEVGEQAQALVVAAAQGQALFGVLLVGVADQRVDQPGGLFQLRVQMFQRVAAVDQDVGAAALAQFAEQGEEGSELLEGFAAGDGDTLGLLQPWLDVGEQACQGDAPPARPQVSAEMQPGQRMLQPWNQMPRRRPGPGWSPGSAPATGSVPSQRRSRVRPSASRAR